MTRIGARIHAHVVAQGRTDKFLILYCYWLYLIISGTLRNLKKVEQALDMLNKLMDDDISED